MKMSKTRLLILKNTPYFIIKSRRRLFKLFQSRKIKRYNQMFIKAYGVEPPLFSRIEIETINRCNGRCSFCPVNINEKQREYKKMDYVVFDKIINELDSINYAGVINLFSNNEPFLDNRIIEFARKTKNMLGKASIHIYTNGELLTLDKFIEIIPYVDKFMINNYNDSFELNSGVQAVFEYYLNDKSLKNRVGFLMRKQTEVLSTRGGQSPNNNKRKTISASCLLPWKQLVIRPDGKVSLCCNDPLGKHTLGDVTQQSLTDIWYSDKYKAIRAKLEKGRGNIDLCRFCDTICT